MQAFLGLIWCVARVGLESEMRHLRAQVELGLVWVWPEPGPEALLQSAAKRPALCQLVKDVDPGVTDTYAAHLALPTSVHQSTGRFM